MAMGDIFQTSRVRHVTRQQALAWSLSAAQRSSATITRKTESLSKIPKYGGLLPRSA
jgi:hypothetical protein